MTDGCAQAATNYSVAINEFNPAIEWVCDRMLVKLLFYAGRRIASPSVYKPGRKWLEPNKWSEKGNLGGTRDHFSNTQLLSENQSGSLNFDYGE
jgi:hypothetical protein